jgi:hypothetical protein
MSGSFGMRNSQCGRPVRSVSVRDSRSSRDTSQILAWTGSQSLDVPRPSTYKAMSRGADGAVGCSAQLRVQRQPHMQRTHRRASTIPPPGACVPTVSSRSGSIELQLPISTTLPQGAHAPSARRPLLQHASFTFLRERCRACTQNRRPRAQALTC